MITIKQKQQTNNNIHNERRSFCFIGVGIFFEHVNNLRTGKIKRSHSIISYDQRSRAFNVTIDASVNPCVC